MKVEFHPETVVDLVDAISFYDEQHPGLGSEFRSEIYETIDRIVDEELLRILVIRHHRRHPEFGIRRRKK